MARNAEQTRQRLLTAASEEFAALGIAGARVDRIAVAADCNKALIYTFFGSKDQLFEAVFAAEVTDRIGQVTFDPIELPDYAGRLFDCFAARPDTLRLYIWYNLERPGGPSLLAIGQGNKSKVALLEKAQAGGLVSDHYAAVELLTLIRSIASAWALLSHSSLGATATAERVRNRHTVVDAVQRLIRPD